MEVENQKVNQPYSLKNRGFSDPLVIGAGALILGFMIGSGRWEWLSRGATKIAGSLGNLALVSLFHSFQEHNPDLFDEQHRVTH